MQQSLMMRYHFAHDSRPDVLRRDVLNLILVPLVDVDEQHHPHEPDHPDLEAHGEQGYIFRTSGHGM